MNDVTASTRAASGRLEAGRVTRHGYDAARTDFVQVLREPLTLDGVCFLDPAPAADRDALAALAERLGSVRAALMETVAGTAFQRPLVAFSSALLERHFRTDCLFQKVPSLRLFLPGALGTSWHTDHWYGHPVTSTTFWVPVTTVARGAGVRFVEDSHVLDELEADLDGSLGLQAVNTRCGELGVERRCAVGEYLAFGARVLHGSVDNGSGRFRCSFDFRGMPLAEGVGNKPLSHYRRVARDGVRDAVAGFVGGRGVKYVSGAGGASTKYRHVLIEAYARDQGLALVRNEAEIESVPSRPVLSAYARRDVPEPGQYDHVLLGSIDDLPADPVQTRRLLSDALATGVTLHFVCEDRVLPHTIDVESCLAWRARHMSC